MSCKHKSVINVEHFQKMFEQERKMSECNFRNCRIVNMQTFLWSSLTAEDCKMVPAAPDEELGETVNQPEAVALS